MKLFIAAMAAFLPISGAYAYEMNPWKDRASGGQKPPALIRKFDTVHEDITYAALGCADSLSLSDATSDRQLCALGLRQRSRSDPGNIRAGIIVGLWWNDDPSHLAYANLMLPAAIQYLEMKEVAKRVRTSASPRPDRKMRNLLFRSHYGDLQFLHGMATADHESPTATQQKIIDWMNFAYHVSTGEVTPSTPLIATTQPVKSLFADRPRLTADGLFKSNRSSMAHLSVQELALGSMLHLVQDSYAAGHTLRDNSPSVACSAGRIEQFYSYLHQDSRRHLELDSRQAYQNASTPHSLSNPVEASARLILFTRARADWTTVVEPFLRSTLFCLDSDTKAAGPGFVPYASKRLQRQGAER